MRHLVTALLALSLGLASCAATPANTDAEPGKDFYINKELTSKGGKRFALLAIKKSHNFYNAFMYCRRYGMMLPSIETEEEFNLLSDTLQASGFQKAHKHVWTSGSDAAEEGKYSWMTSGHLLSDTFTSWWAGEPNNSGDKGEAENCVAMDWRDEEKGDDEEGGEGGYKYNDVNCLHHRYIACEYFPKPTTEYGIGWKMLVPDE